MNEHLKKRIVRRHHKKKTDKRTVFMYIMRKHSLLFSKNIYIKKSAFINKI